MKRRKEERKKEREKKKEGEEKQKREKKKERLRKKKSDRKMNEKTYENVEVAIIFDYLSFQYMYGDVISSSLPFQICSMSLL